MNPSRFLNGPEKYPWKGGTAIPAPAPRHSTAASDSRLVSCERDRAGLHPNEYVAIAPIYLVAAAIVAGDMLGNAGLNPAFALVVLGAGAAFGLYLTRRPLTAVIIALATIGASSGVSAYRVHHPLSSGTSITRFPDRSLLTLEGIVARPADDFPHETRIYVDIARAGLTAGRLLPAAGTVRITVPAPAGFALGDEIRATGTIRYPYQFGDIGEFDYTGYLERQGIVATMYVSGGRNGSSIIAIGHKRFFLTDFQEQIRRKIGKAIDSNLVQPESGVLRAIVLGDRGGLAESTRDQFARAGMAHLLVISGLHMGLLAATVFAAVRLFTGWSRSLTERGFGTKIAAAMALLAVVAYAAIARGHVSTIRALIMAATYMFAVMLDRPRAIFSALALAAIVICFVYPGSTGDAAFQLTFAAVVVIVLGMRRTIEWRRAIALSIGRSALKQWPARIAWFVAASVAVSFWSALGTAPLTARHFNQVSIVGLAANTVIVPIIGLGATVLGLAGVGMCLLSAAAAAMLLHLAGLLIGLGIWLARWFLEWPASWIRTFTPTWLEVLTAYGFLALWLFRPKVESSGWATRLHWTGFAFLAALTIGDAGWWVAQRYFDEDMRVTFLAVGQGDAAVIRFPGSRVMLIDAGGSFAGLDPGETVVARYLWSRKIMRVNYLVVSHPDLDHFGGFMFIARNFHPDEFWAGPEPGHDRSYSNLLDVLDREGVRRREIDAAVPPIEINGVTVQCLGPWPGDRRDNDASMVLKLIYGRSSVLFTGDIEAPGERTLLDTTAALQSTVLKVPHHGSISSSTEDFARAVDPALAVISLGYQNRYGFPSSAVVDRYRELGAQVARTDETGEIDLDASRDQVRAYSYRGELAYERSLAPH